MTGISVEVISYLRTNLRDRYKDSFAILKELVQNADDAGASELYVTSYEAFGSHFKHPLLTGPIVSVVNNAEFSLNDACAIHQAGIGSKGLDDEKIGKFGLGLKSVFHLCEALFYVSSANAEDAAASTDHSLKYGRDGLLNPWHEQRYRHWETIEEEDIANLKRLVKAQFESHSQTPPEHWFAIFLPLRLPIHCIDPVQASIQSFTSAEQLEEAKKWALEPKFPTLRDADKDELLDAPHHIERIHGVLPLLTQLRRIQFNEANGDPLKSPVCKAVIEFKSDTERLDWRRMSVGTAREHGTIAVQQKGEESIESVYSVAQTLADLPDLNRITQSANWPWMDALDEVEGWKRKPAVAKQHGAVSILDTAGSGTLDIKRAVFLPLAELSNRSFKSTLPCGGNRDYRVLLHGYCFVDAGRLGIDEANSGEIPSARQQWNDTLIKKVTLPLLIPALEEYRDSIYDLQDRDARLEHLTSGLASAVGNEYAQFVCCEKSWLCVLRGKEAKWESCPNSTNLIPLPGGKEDIAAILKLFPVLREVSQDHTLVLRKMPSLSVAERCEWPLNLATQLLDSVPVDLVTRNSDLLQTLLQFCEFIKEQLGQSIEFAIGAMVGRILSDEKVPLSRLRKNDSTRVSFGKLLRLVPESRKLWVPFRDDLVRESENLREKLQNVAKERIVLPSVLDPSARTCGLSDAEAKKLLTELSLAEPKGSNAPGHRKLINEATDWVLDAWPRSIEELFNNPLCDLPLFSVRDYSTDSFVKSTPFELFAAAEDHRLFSNNAQLCNKLQSCLANQSILYVDSPSKCFTQALGADLPPCTPKACTAFLARRPNLVENLEPRVQFLEQLTSSGADIDWEVIRYLLHGQKEQDAEKLSLIAIDDSPWGKLTNLLLESHCQNWRGLSITLLENLTAAQQRNLRISPGSAEVVAELSRHVDTSALDLASIVRDQTAYSAIVRNWPAEQDEGLRRLPIFKTAEKKLTSITDHTFINLGNELPPKYIFPDLVLIEDPEGILESRKLAPTLNTQDILRKLLRQSNCHNHWQYIMDQLSEEVEPTLKPLLTEIAWLQTADATPVSPSQIVTDDVLKQHVAALRSLGAPLVHQSDLHPEMRRHPGWNHVTTRLCPSKAALCKAFGECLRVLPSYRIGARSWQDGRLESLIDLFADADETFPAVGLIQTLRGLSGVSLQQLEQVLLPEIGKRIDVDRSVLALQHLREKHEYATPTQRSRILELFNIFLDEALTQDEFAKQLGAVSLLNRTGEWREGAQLAIEGHNIAPSSLLDSTQSSVLAKHRFRLSDKQDSSRGNELLSREAFEESQISAGKQALEEYLKQWLRDEIPGDAVASLVALFGSNDGFREMYDRFKEGRDWQTMRNLLLGVTSNQSRYLSYRFCITKAEPLKVDAINICGDDFFADVSAEITCLFDGFGNGRFVQYIPLPRDEKGFPIRLRAIEASNFTQSQKLEILRNTVVAVRRGIYQIQDDLDDSWEKITNVNQLDIDTAQKLILESSAMLLETQLAGAMPDALRSIFNSLHLVRQRETACEQAGTTQRELESIRCEKREIFEQLREKLCEDDEVEQHLIQMIRERLESQSYDQSSVPFELFQNADDAVVELSSLASSADELERMRPASLRDQFIIEHDFDGDRHVVRFCHWGRGINQFKGVSKENPDFCRDMERMLVLQGSGKHGESDQTRTGGFGMGFKSVLFVCDRPVVFSGARSRFRVLAGVYPKALSTETDRQDENRLRKRLDHLGDHNQKGTIVELRLNRGIDADSMLHRFRSVAGYLVVFSRSLRRCEVGKEGSQADSFSWNPERIAENVVVGDVQTPSLRHRAILVNSVESSDAVLIPTNKGGVTRGFVADVPEIWVTTPTAHKGKSGLLINGGFDLNPGRTQLRDTVQNSNRANKIGKLLGNALCDLFELCREDWGRYSAILGCPKVSEQEFWSSLWAAATKTLDFDLIDPAKKVARTVFFGNERSGIFRLISDHPALPTGLTGEYDILAKLSDCQWRVEGILARESVWNIVSGIEAVQERFKPGTVVSARLSKELSSFDEETFRALRPLTVGEVLRELVGNKTSVSPQLADELSRFINKSVWREIEGIESLRPELEAVEETLAQMMFETEDGDWSRPGLILSAMHHDEIRSDERARAAFAPQTNLLSRNYSYGAVEFFAICRGDLRTPISTLASWVASASTTETQFAALSYLCSGDLSTQVREAVRQGLSQGGGSWLTNRRKVERACKKLEPPHQALVGTLLGFIENPWTDATEEAASRHSTEPKQVLSEIFEWWRENRKKPQEQFDGRSYLEEYARRTWPGGLPTHLDSEAFNDDEQYRTEWTTLFLLALMHTIGRSLPSQHRSFISRCRREGWLELFASSEASSEHWMSFVSDYIDRQIDQAEYFHWMRQFVGIFQMSRYLDGYVELFLSIDRISRPFQLIEVLHSRTSSLYQGGGVDLPPLSRVLGLGSTFVVRELVRFNVLNSEYALEHCFVPVKRVRLVFKVLGCDGLDLSTQRWEMSSYLFRFASGHLGAQHATFMNDFDIPFQFVAEDEELRHRLFLPGSLDDDTEEELDRDDHVY